MGLKASLAPVRRPLLRVGRRPKLVPIDDAVIGDDLNGRRPGRLAEHMTP